MDHYIPPMDPRELIGYKGTRGNLGEWVILEIYFDQESDLYRVRTNLGVISWSRERVSKLLENPI
jgi:hypothetical protein